MAGKQAVVQHIRVGEHPPGVRAHPVPLGHRGVAVITSRAHLGQAQGGHRPDLVGPQRLGGCEVQRGGLVIDQQVGEYRQLVGQRLARGGTGRHHDMAAGPGQLCDSDLVCPWRRYTCRGERLAQPVRYPQRPVSGSRCPRGQRHDVPQR